MTFTIFASPLKKSITSGSIPICLSKKTIHIGIMIPPHLSWKLLIIIFIEKNNILIVNFQGIDFHNTCTLNIFTTMKKYWQNTS